MMILENSSVASTAVSKTHGATEAKECTNVIKLKKEGFKVRYSISCTKKKNSEDMTASHCLQECQNILKIETHLQDVKE